MCSLEKKNQGGGSGVTTSLCTQPPACHLDLIWDQGKPSIFLCAQGMSGHLKLCTAAFVECCAVLWGAQLLFLHSPLRAPGLPVPFPQERSAGAARSGAWLCCLCPELWAVFAGRWPKAGALLALTGMGGDRGHKLALKTAPAGAVKVMMVLDWVSVLSVCQQDKKLKEKQHSLHWERILYMSPVCVCVAK